MVTIYETRRDGYLRRIENSKGCRVGDAKEKTS